MPYSQFTTLESSVQQFGLTVSEVAYPLISYTPIEASPFLEAVLDRALAWAIAVGTEKARSEALILQLLLEVREQLDRQVSVFSGREFNVDVSQGLNGYCDFLISRATQQTVITAPATVVVEAKKGDLSLGLGQCAAEMVAAQQFNQQRDRPLPAIHGAVSSGTLWQFLMLQGQNLTIDLTEYALPPVDTVLGLLVAMAEGKNQ
ncbi:MAG TPA: hypothetical protein V6D18_14040 [Thermosynechococcaceae cyanobacterium]